MLCQELLQASSLSVFQDITRFSGKGWPLYTIPLTGVGSYVYVILPEHGIRRSRKPHDPAALKPKQLSPACWQGMQPSQREEDFEAYLRVHSWWWVWSL